MKYVAIWDNFGSTVICGVFSEEELAWAHLRKTFGTAADFECFISEFREDEGREIR